jgi:hypothetical protein
MIAVRRPFDLLPMRDCPFSVQSSNYSGRGLQRLLKKWERGQGWTDGEVKGGKRCHLWESVIRERGHAAPGLASPIDKRVNWPPISFPARDLDGAVGKAKARARSLSLSDISWVARTR